MRYSHSYKKRKSNKSGKYLLAIFVIIVLFKTLTNTNSPKEVIVTIPKGASVNYIADILEENGVIKSPLFFKSYLKSTDQTNTLLAGTFKLQTGDSIENIVKTLQTYQSESYKVTIPEGYKTSQIKDLANDQCLENCEFIHEVFRIPSLENLSNYEGLLFPDTYYLDKNSNNKTQLLNAMLDNFVAKLPTDFKSSLEKLPKKDLYYN